MSAGTSRVDAAAHARRVLLVLTTVRAGALAFSVPYVVAWTGGLEPWPRLWLAVGHGAALLATATASDAVDAARGLAPRLALPAGRRWHVRALAWRAAVVLGGIALLAAGALLPDAPWLAAGIAAGLAVGIGLAWLPSGVKHLGVAEVAGPAVLLAAPAAGLALVAEAEVPWLSVASACGCWAALILTLRVDERAADLADDVPTVATRRPQATRTWRWMTGIAGALAGIATLTHPLGAGGRLALLAGLAFAAALALPRHRAAALAGAHALLALSWLVR